MSPTSYQAAPPRINEPESIREAGECQAERSARGGSRGPRSARASRAFSPELLIAQGLAAILRGLDRAVPTPMRKRDAFSFRRSPLNRLRSGALFLAACLTLFPAGRAFAAAEVHRFSLALSAVPTQVQGGDFNDGIEFYNRTVLDPRGAQPIDKITFSWLYDAELRYALTKSLTLDAGVSQLRAQKKQEYLPAIAQAIDVRAEMLTVPIHVGAAYYLQAYNQGDFQSRAFFGGGLESYTHTRATFEQVLASPDSVTNAQLGGSYKIITTQDSPGYYLEGGVHMFFASRYSILVSALWRRGEIADVRDERTGKAVFDPLTGRPLKLDVGGIGLRMAAVIGL